MLPIVATCHREKGTGQKSMIYLSPNHSGGRTPDGVHCAGLTHPFLGKDLHPQQDHASPYLLEDDQKWLFVAISTSMVRAGGMAYSIPWRMRTNDSLPADRPYSRSDAIYPRFWSNDNSASKPVTSPRHNATHPCEFVPHTENLYHPPGLHTLSSHPLSWSSRLPLLGSRRTSG